MSSQWSINFSRHTAALELWRYGEDDAADKVLTMRDRRFGQVLSTAERLSDPAVPVPVSTKTVNNGHVMCFACIEVIEGRIRPLSRDRRRPLKDAPPRFIDAFDDRPSQQVATSTDGTSAFSRAWRRFRSR